MMASKVVWMIIQMLIIVSQKLMDQEVVLNFFDIYSYFIKIIYIYILISDQRGFGVLGFWVLLVILYLLIGHGNILH